MLTRIHRLSCLSLRIFLLFSLPAAPAWAGEQPALADLPFDELTRQEVVSASRMARQISDSPSAVAIVTADDIRAYGYRTLADVINSMRGLYTTYDRRYQYMGGRGFGAPGEYAGRIMVLIDGYATQDSLFNQAYIEESGLLDLELVERVEYVPGTGSVTYGNNALLGIINVVTRKGGDFNATQVSGELASHGSRKQRVTTGKRFENGADLLLSASRLDVEGQNLHFPAYDTPATHNGWANGLDSEGNKRLFGKLSHDGLTLEGAYVDRQKDVPTNPTTNTRFGTPFTTRDRNAFLNLRHETDLSLTLHSASSLYLGSYHYENRREFANYAPPDTRRYAQRDFDGRWWGFDQKLVGNWFHEHSLMLGLEFRGDYHQNFAYRYLSPTGTPMPERNIDESYGRRTTSFYLADEYRWNDRWSFNLGVRYDKASDARANWSPRLAAIWRPDFQTTLKLSYSEAFRLPNADERSNYGSMAAPEFVKATELVVQHQFSRHLRLTSSLYHYRRSGQLVEVTTGDYRPVGGSETEGAEIELERSWENGMRSRGSVAWQHARDVSGADLANSPDWLGKYNLSFPVLSDAWRVGVEAQYVGPRLTLERRRLGSYSLANLTVSSERKWHGFSASFSIRNLFDRDYDVVSPFDWRPASGIAQDSLRMDGRTYWMQLNYDL